MLCRVPIGYPVSRLAMSCRQRTPETEDTRKIRPKRQVRERIFSHTCHVNPYDPRTKDTGVHGLSDLLGYQINDQGKRERERADQDRLFISACPFIAREEGVLFSSSTAHQSTCSRGLNARPFSFAPSVEVVILLH